MQQQSFRMPAYLKALSVMTFIIVSIFLLIVGKSLLIPLFLGGFFAILFTPFCNWMEKYRIPKTLSSVLALSSMILLVGGLFSFIIGNIASFTKDFDDVSGKLSWYAEHLDEWTATNFQIDPEIRKKMNTSYLKEILTENSSSISDFALKTAGSLSGVILIPVFMFFFLLYRNHLTEMMVMIYRDRDPLLVKMRISSLRKVIQNYIIGVGKVMFILAILNIIAYTALGIKHAVFFGVLGAILNIIPYIGPFFGALLPISYSFLTTESLFYPIALLVCYQFIQMLEGNVLTPKIVGGNVNLNAFITFLGLLIGGTIWGVAGMILVIPMMAVLREIFELNEDTKPFALLLGEEKGNKKIKSKTEDDEE